MEVLAWDLYRRLTLRAIEGGSDEDRDLRRLAYLIFYNILVVRGRQ